ncbi:E3 ubiquitin-protein ligase znrf1 isoform X3 [Narcine bancroftii]|uniref:E3 ubiquitin-protein ligase znrf1 isoform X3 n=1 Tax=Narcine bancroftii TaxID=1343680 RepID=UPI003831CCA0
MGGKQSTAARSRTAFPGVSTDDSAVHAAHYGHYRSGVNTMGLRTRSVSSVAGMEPAHPFGLYGSGGARSAAAGGGGSRSDGGGGFKCPICSKSVASDEMEMHFIMCLSKPRLSYNDDVLSKDAGECVICLEELLQGDTIARLPCLCIYHKSCIDSWFEVNRSCPEHPSD